VLISGSNFTPEPPQSQAGAGNFPGRAGANRGIESSREKFNHETRAGKRNLADENLF
jgi:hypothetical protein